MKGRSRLLYYVCIQPTGICTAYWYYRSPQILPTTFEVIGVIACINHT